MMKIRYANLSDTKAIAEFNRALALESEDLELDSQRLLEGVRAVLEDSSKGLYFVAQEASRIVGQTMITFEWSDWRNGVVWWIQSVYVLPEFRRRGVFKALFSHIEGEAKRLGTVRGLRLYVVTHNEAAKKTYERMGMEKTVYELYEKDFVIRRKNQN